MNAIFKLLLLICLTIFSIDLHAQGMVVAKWSIQEMGNNENDCQLVMGYADGIMIVKDNSIYFSLIDPTSDRELAPTIKISKLDQSTEQNNKYIILNGAATLLGSNFINNYGNMTLKLSKFDDNDIICFNFYSDNLYLSGNLVDEEYIDRLSTLAHLCSVVETGSQLKVTFESALRQLLSK